MAIIFTNIERVLIEEVFYHSGKNIVKAKNLLEMLQSSSSNISQPVKSQPVDEDKELERILKESEEQFRLENERKA